MHFFIPLFTKKEVHRESDQGTNHRPKIPPYWPQRTTVTVLLPEQPVTRKLVWGGHTAVWQRAPVSHWDSHRSPPNLSSQKPPTTAQGWWVGNQSVGGELLGITCFSWVLLVSLSPPHYCHYILFYFNYFSISTHKFYLFKFSSPSHQGGREQEAAWYLSGLKQWQ